MSRPQKITFGEMRSSGPTRVVVFCSDYRCAHSTVVDAAQWPDDIRLSDLEPSSSARSAAIAAPMSGRSLREEVKPPTEQPLGEVERNRPKFGR
jgi:hypothetical protein